MIKSIEQLKKKLLSTSPPTPYQIPKNKQEATLNYQKRSIKSIISKGPYDIDLSHKKLIRPDNPKK